MIALDERQTVRLVSALAEVDALLTEATRYIDAAALRSPFAERLGDVTPIQRQMIAQDVERLRAIMRSILERQRVVMPPPVRSAAAACRAAIGRAVIAVEELGPRYLRREGALSDEAAADTNRVVSQLLDGLMRMEDHLAAGEAADLPMRPQSRKMDPIQFSTKHLDC